MSDLTWFETTVDGVPMFGFMDVELADVLWGMWRSVEEFERTLSEVSESAAAELGECAPRIPEGWPNHKPADVTPLTGMASKWRALCERVAMRTNASAQEVMDAIRRPPTALDGGANDWCELLERRGLHRLATVTDVEDSFTGAIPHDAEQWRELLRLTRLDEEADRDPFTGVSVAGIFRNMSGIIDKATRDTRALSVELRLGGPDLVSLEQILGAVKMLHRVARR